jgi:hypothetical protein
MATLADIQNKIYDLTGTDSVSYPNAKMLIDINLWNQKIGGMILDSQDESDFDDPNHGDYPVLTVPLTTNRDYSIAVAEKMLKIKDLTVFYDGVNGYRATPIDSSELSVGVAPSSATVQNNNIDANFSRTSPEYDMKYGAIWLYPRATSTDVSNSGYMIVEWFRQIKEFTSSDLTTGTAVAGFDDTFHMMLAYGPAWEYCLAKQLPQLKGVAEMLADYEVRLNRQYGAKQLDRKYKIGTDYQSYK